MSGIINKVKEAVTGHHSADTTTHSTTHDNTGTHGSSALGGSNTHGSSAIGGSNYDNQNTHSTGLGSSNYDNTSSSGGVIPGNADHKKNILAPATTGTAGSHAYGAPGTYGETGDYSNTRKSNAHNEDRDDTSELHNSKLGNKVDPRVDSNTLDRSGGQGTAYGSTATGGHHSNTHNAGPHSSNIGTGVGSHSHSNTGYGSSTTSSGPHNSNVANKLDPRVDSDRSNDYSSSNTGYNQGQHGVSSLLSDRAADKVESHHQPGYVATGNHSDNIGMSNRFDDYTSSGTHGTHGTSGGLTGNTSSGYNTTDGPHNSNAANKLDPRVDSDRDGSRTTGQTGYGSSTGSGYDNNNSSSYGSGNTGSGSIPPHNSSLLNKLDPRVDTTNTNTTGSGYNSGSTGNNYSSGTGNTGTNNHPYSSNQ